MINYKIIVKYIFITGATDYSQMKDSGFDANRTGASKRLLYLCLTQHMAVKKSRCPIGCNPA